MVKPSLLQVGLLLLTFAAAVAAPTRASVSEAIDVIPAPARVTSRDGVFAFRADTRVSLPPDPGVARIARYFAELLHLKVTAGGSASAPIVFRLERAVAGTSPEAYAIDISPRQVVVSAG